MKAPACLSVLLVTITSFLPAQENGVIGIKPTNIQLRADGVPEILLENVTFVRYSAEQQRWLPEFRAEVSRKCQYSWTAIEVKVVATLTNGTFFEYTAHRSQVANERELFAIPLPPYDPTQVARYFVTL